MIGGASGFLGAIDSAIGPPEFCAVDATHPTAEVEALGGSALYETEPRAVFRFALRLGFYDGDLMDVLLLVWMGYRQEFITQREMLNCNILDQACIPPIRTAMVVMKRVGRYIKNMVVSNGACLREPCRSLTKVDRCCRG